MSRKQKLRDRLSRLKRLGARRRKQLIELRRKIKTTRRKLAAASELRERAWKESGEDLHVREVGGNNSGPDVERIIRQGGGNPAAKPPWCVYGVAAWYRRAGSKAAWDVAGGAVRHMDLIPGVRKTRRPRRGDPVRFNFDHTGIFGSYCDAAGNKRPRASATHIRTREANTGESGAVSDSRSGGDGVYEKIRPRSLVADYLKVIR